MPAASSRPRDLPLSALRAFEAAARLGSFVAAGDELGVTAGAITAHIRTLEAILGARLFERAARGVRITALGQRALPHFVEAFDMLGAAAHKLRHDANRHAIHIATSPAIAQLWLSPRLPALRSFAPEVVISIAAMDEPPNLKRSPYDLSLFYTDSRESWLFEDVIFPVCSPDFAARLPTIESLASVPCLVDTTWKNDWDRWLEASVPGAAFKLQGASFSLYVLAVEQALRGAGVLIAHESLVLPYLASGELVAPFRSRVSTGRGLHLWGPHGRSSGGPVRMVEEWLRDDARSSLAA